MDSRVKQLKFCEICKEQKFDVDRGIICGLTNSLADFDVSCSSFNEDVEFTTALKRDKVLSLESGLGKRFLNYILDFIFLLFFAYGFGFFLGMMLGVIFAASPDFLYYILTKLENNKLFDYSLRVVVIMVYFVVSEALTGRTLAKFITRTKVVTEEGEKPGFQTIFIRSLCRLVPLDNFSFLWAETTGWHDRWSKTIVIDCSKQKTSLETPMVN
jgi:uncharacterized RDD family membrane protein YckC